MPALLPLSLAIALAAIHVFGWRLRFLSVLPRSAWLSFAGGTSVAYVFVHLLPEMAALQEALAERVAGFELFEARHVWLLALAGLVAFYGLEHLASRSREEGQDEAMDRTGAGVFWVHMASYGVYNVLVGYLLAWGESRTTSGVLLFALAMAFHFVVNDTGLRHDHKERYLHVGRWLLAGAVVLGCGLGFVTEVSEATIAALLGILGGSVILNVLKEELPEERESRFWPFLAGAVAYSALLLLV
ncbi:hypothetical protein [Rubricoccus marinus]|uniref:Zinc permease n=1 Tax=Rubricoccus marinus TaxID=716817 RepID=A0A259TVA4_9BACT|nr:hypothetical protein [Rubricoccus marinus]OZC01699.1 hypothetical protein BSZ36_01095 [Rubricoccus marinus]